MGLILETSFFEFIILRMTMMKLLSLCNVTKKSKGKFLHSTVSNPQDCSKCFTLTFADKPVHLEPSRLLWELDIAGGYYA